MQNPYTQFIGDRPPLEVISMTAKEIEELLRRIGPARMETPRAPGKWNAREILAHLADCEIAFGFRLRQAVADPDHVIQPFDQDRWAKQYAHSQANSALAAFVGLRRWNEEFMRHLSPDLLAIKVMHPERGELTVQNILEIIAGHDLNHLAQLEAIARLS